jgi:hypothetical protein
MGVSEKGVDKEEHPNVLPILILDLVAFVSQSSSMKVYKKENFRW